MRLFPWPLTALVAVCGVVVAQVPTSIDAVRLPAPDALRVPIHTAPADVDGAYGIWAAGDDYKVSFDGDFTFVPVLGRDAPRNLPFRWTTDSVQIGTTELWSGERIPVRVDDWRYEYRRTFVTEAYDVRADGVEQSFVVRTRGPGVGDLVVRGRVTTPLHAAPRVVAHGELVFVDDDGASVVCYGAATAIDANGATAPMTTSWDGDALTLRLDGAWFAHATLPVTVDPLVSSAVLSLGGGALGEPSIATAHGTDDVAVTVVRYSSAADADLFVRLTDGAWTSPVTVFADVTTTWSTPHADVCHAYGARRWVVAMERGFPAAQVSLIRDHVHDVDDRGLSTSYGIVTSTSAEQCTHPSIGGAGTANTEVLIAYQLDRGGFGVDTTSSEVWAAIRDAASGALRTPFELGHRTVGFDAELPDVAPDRDHDGPWFVALQEIQYGAGARERAEVVRVMPDATLRGPFAVGDQSYLHWVRPRIAGGGGEFMLIAACGGLQQSTYERTSGFYVRAVRFQWPDSVSVPSIAPSTEVRGVYAGLLSIHGLAVAFDAETHSHWAVWTLDTQTGSVVADRLGYWSGIAESVAMQSATSLVAAAYSTARDAFVAVHDAGTNLLGTRFEYPAQRAPIYYEPGCGAGQAVIWSGHAGAPLAGSNNCTLELFRIPRGASVILLLSTARAHVPLDPFGMTGCALGVDLAAPHVVVPFDVVGDWATVRLPLHAPMAGTFFAQFVYTESGANPLGLVTSNAIEFDVR